MAQSIHSSVGQGGVNKLPDVQTVQSLLNQVPAAQAGPDPLLVVDGLVGPLTIGAIRKFQQKQFGWNDGRVDPNNKTIKRLNDFDKAPLPGSPTRFVRAPNPNALSPPADGFEPGVPGTGVAPWIMVPRGGSRFVRLLNGNDVRQVTSDNPNIATALNLGVAVQVFGISHGKTTLKARDSHGRFVARLDVSVKRRRTVRTSFHFVQDKKRRTMRTPGNVDPQRTGDSLDTLITKINKIYIPQANVEFIKKQVNNPLKYDRDFGSEVRFTAHLKNVPISEHEWDIVVGKRDPGADFNVFFVWEYEDNLTPGDQVEAGTLASDKSCLFDDVLSMDMDEVLGHEAGHNLGLGHSSNTDDLMLDDGVSKKKLPRAAVEHINP